MPLFMENFGLDFLTENEDTIRGLMADVAEKARPIMGYYGLPYLNHEYGDVQIILHTERRPEDGVLEVVGMDSHAAGRAVWEVRLSGPNMNHKDTDRLSRRVIVTRSDGGGMAVVNLVNADVLPGFLEDDSIKMQVIAFPELIEYFQDEDAYADSQPSSKDGGKWLLGEGTVFPSGVMRNRNPNSPEFDTDERLDDIVTVRGIAKSLVYGKLEMGSEEQNPFIYCDIDTEFGPLEIVHTIAQVEEAQRKNLRPGSVVVFCGTISGDVAIYEYEKGIVRDEAHNLAVLRYIFTGNDPERLRTILSENTVYLEEYSGKSYAGPDAIIERLQFLQKDHSVKYFAHMATIISIDDGEETLPYSVGKRCIVLASGEETKYESIIFIEVDSNGNICRLVTSGNPRYHFAIDEKSDSKTGE